LIAHPQIGFSFERAQVCLIEAARFGSPSHFVRLPLSTLAPMILVIGRGKQFY